MAWLLSVAFEPDEKPGAEPGRNHPTALGVWERWIGRTSEAFVEKATSAPGGWSSAQCVSLKIKVATFEVVMLQCNEKDLVLPNSWLCAAVYRLAL